VNTADRDGGDGIADADKSDRTIVESWNSFAVSMDLEFFYLPVKIIRPNSKLKRHPI
jgi:hypothetical protein